MDLTNIFKSQNGNKELILRNEHLKRDSVSHVEIYNTAGEDPELLANIRIDPKDNVAMALSVLGIGRVTDDVEDHAQTVAAEAALHTSSAELLLHSAVINLRAAMILKEREDLLNSDEVKDAYALYKLAYPATATTLKGFASYTQSRERWVTKLKALRDDVSSTWL